MTEDPGFEVCVTCGTVYAPGSLDREGECLRCRGRSRPGEGELLDTKNKNE